MKLLNSPFSIYSLKSSAQFTRKGYISPLVNTTWASVPVTPTFTAIWLESPPDTQLFPVDKPHLSARVAVSARTSMWVLNHFDQIKSSQSTLHKLQRLQECSFKLSLKTLQWMQNQKNVSAYRQPAESTGLCMIRLLSTDLHVWHRMWPNAQKALLAFFL